MFSQNGGFPYLGVDILKICQPVGAVFRIPNIVDRNLLIAPGALEDTVYKIGNGTGIVRLILVVPLGRDLVGGIARGKNIG